MGDLLYFIKTIVLAAVVVILLQIKIGDETLERVAERHLIQSEVGEYLTEVAQGAVGVLGKGFNQFFSVFNLEFDKRFSRNNVPGQRAVIDGFDRSKAYITDAIKKKENREKILEEYQEAEAYIEDYGSAEANR